MNPLTWLLSLVVPACGFSGAGGLPVPPLLDIAHVVRPSSPNTALAAPAGFNPTPDIVTPAYRISTGRLFPLIQEVARAQDRTYQAALYQDSLQVHYVARSAWLNFPDLISVAVTPDGPDASALILYSRSVYGRSDFGVNRRRLQAWLGALEAKLSSSSER